MKPFTSHRGLAVSLDRANVDTDAIIAKQFLKSISRVGFGEHLFHDWRTNPDGTPNATFSLNQPRFKGASILVARNNFGCGSSREHAVWAIHQYGFQVIVAPWQESGGSRVPAFADIFRNNCSKNALLTIELSPKEVDQIFDAIAKNPGLEATADLQDQTLTLHSPEPVSFRFDIEPSIKHKMLNGLDEIGLTLQHIGAISEFEKRHDTQLPK